MNVKIATDGCRKGNGMGGWAFLMDLGDSIEIGGGYCLSTTNNICEMLGPLYALQRIKEILAIKQVPFRRASITITSDSQYFVNGFNSWSAKWQRLGWKKSINGRGIKNPLLWSKLKTLKDYTSAKCEWTRGHAGHSENELCDYIANYCCANKVSIKGNLASLDNLDLGKLVDYNYEHKEYIWMLETHQQEKWINEEFKLS